MVRHLVTEHGLTKVRLTGGDPTARADLLDIIRQVSRIQGVGDLAMTTNGLTLARHAADYAAAGLGRVNISLDSLDRKRFADMTGVDGMDRVIAGIDTALIAGLTPVKINTVVLRDGNLADLPALVDFAASRQVEVRFIELMPMGPLGDQWADRYVPASVMRNRLESVVHCWEPLPQGSDSALRYRVTLRDGRSACIGFITPMSCNFCSACNRLRITSDGSVYPCLMDQPRGSIMHAVRPRLDTQRFDRVLEQALQDKAPEHPTTGFAVMTQIGG